MSNEFFAGNMTALSGQPEANTLRQMAQMSAPGCTVEPSRAGGPTLSVNGHTVHSKYAPEREAEGLAKKLLGDGPKPAGILLLGLGLGYLPEALLKLAPDSKLIVVEPESQIFASAMQARDQRELLERATILVASSIEELEKQASIQLAACRGKVSCIVSPSARSYAPDAVVHLEKSFNRRTRLQGRKLRLLVVGPLYGGSLPVTYSAVNALRKLGHKVELLDNSIYNQARVQLEDITRNPDHKNQLQGLFTTLMAETVTAKAMDMRAQIVLFMAQAPATPDVLNELRNAGIPTAFWFVEDGRLMQYGLRVAPWYDVFFHIQKGPFEQELKAAGARHVHYLPMAADPDIHMPLELDAEDQNRYGSDISHMGAGYYNRRHFFLGLLDYNFKLWGNEWDGSGGLARVLQDEGRRVSTEEVVKIFNATKVNINLHSSTYTQGVNPNGDFVNPRTFELAACGAFQLVDERSLLPELLEPGKEVVTFTDLSSCRDAIDYYLAHPEEAKQIAEAARKRVLAEHTYVHRMQEMLEVILELHEPAFQESPKNTVESLVEEAGDDAELANFFRKMGEPEEELTLEGIADKIMHDEGDLNETEAVFLLMNEFYQWAKEKGVA